MIAGWLSFREFLPRCAYRGTVELSLYISEQFRRRGLGRRLLQEAIGRAPQLEIHSLVGLIFGHNEPSGHRIGDRMIVNLLNGITQLNGLGLCVPATRNTEAVKNYPRGVGAIEGVEVNAGYVVIQKIVTLFQSEVNTDAPDHFRIVLASL